MSFNKKVKNATVCKEGDLTFKSKQERSIYNYLLSVGIIPKYELSTFSIWTRGEYTVPFYDRYGKTFKLMTRKPTSIHYTPDFTFEINNTYVILEVKGFKNDVFPYKVRLFRDYLEKLARTTEKKLCYAIVYSIKDLKELLKDLNYEFPHQENNTANTSSS